MEIYGVCVDEEILFGKVLVQERPVPSTPGIVRRGSVSREAGWKSVSRKRLWQCGRDWRKVGSRYLFGVLLEESDQIVAILALLETTESHLGSRDVLLGVFEVGEQSVLVPGNALGLVGVGVVVALNLTSLAAEESVKVRSNLVGTTFFKGVALSTAGLEKVSTLGSVTWLERHDDLDVRSDGRTKKGRRIYCNSECQRVR